MNTRLIPKKTILAIAALAAIALAGCASHTPSGYPDTANGYRAAMNTKWILDDLDGQGVIDFAHLWIRFDSDRSIYGSAGCNSFKGKYSVKNGEFKTGLLATTRMACPPAINMQEFKFLQALENIRTIQTRNGMLYMEGNGHRLRFSRQ